MINFLREIGLSDEEILQGCQKKGGLLGISGVSNDLRYVMEAADAGNARAKLGAIGVVLDEEANKMNAAVISAPNSKVTVRVIPADEELGIARRTYELV